MNTAIYKIDATNMDMDVIRHAGQILAQGGLVAFPTETVYGLGADAMDARASAKIDVYKRQLLGRGIGNGDTQK